MLGLVARFQRLRLAPHRSCLLRFSCNFSGGSSSPHQVIQHVDEECGDFLTWLRQKSGAEISSVLSVGKSSYGRSLFACKPIQAGDCILKVPFSALMAPDNLDPSIHSLLGNGVHDVTKLALAILQHQRLGQGSEWAPYISCLPRFADMHSTIFWSDEELKMIKMSSLYDETLKLKARIDRDFSSIKHVLFLFPEYFEGVTLHEFKHAYNLVESRAWMSPRGAALTPFADFLNHDANSEQWIVNDDDEQAIMLTADEDYAPGDEVLVRYGKIANPRLLLTFGFIFPRNKYNQAIVEVNIPQHDPLLALKLDLLHRHKPPPVIDIYELNLRPSENGFVVIDGSASGNGRGIPESLRALARVLCCTSPRELQDLAMEAAENDGLLARIPLRNKEKELEAHQLLHSRFIYLVENYHAALKPLTRLNSGNETRMQMARELLMEELRIIESASAWLKNYCESLKPTGSVKMEVKII